MKLLVKGQTANFSLVNAMLASHYWSNQLDGWIDIDISIEHPRYLSMINGFRNSESAPLAWGVDLEGEPMTKWETADSERGYVDVWARLDNKPIKHRLFGFVEFVRICNSD